MIRTRDFVVVLAIIAFLLLAIGVTLSDRLLNFSLTSSLSFIDKEEVDYVGEVFATETMTREDRIAALRSKISTYSPKAEDLPVFEDEILVTEAITTIVATTTEIIKEAQLCTNHQTYSGSWSTAGIKIVVIEGARIVYREDAIATSSTAERDIILQLPMYIVPNTNNTNCLSSDVVGIAQDGSLIRNNEVAMYSVFGENTLIGYALDGFPIYGSSAGVTDTCGGVIRTGQYRYQLNTDRDTILNCFVASPIKI